MFLRWRAKGFVFGLSADVGFVGFNDLVLAPDGAALRVSLAKTSSAIVGRQIADMQRHNSCTRTAATFSP
jgi:hypothetical protein